VKRTVVYNIGSFGIKNTDKFDYYELFNTFTSFRGNKKYSKMKALKTENQFDTLRIKIPSSTFEKVDFSKFQRKIKVNVETGEIDNDLSGENYWLEETGKGLNSFTYVPHLEIFDCQISAKILGEDYYKGIRGTTIQKVVSTIQDRGIVSGSFDMNTFLEKSQVLRADNTFNIPLTDGEISDYYEAIELIASKGKLGKIDTYTNNTFCTGITLGKNTKKLQKITIYNKIEEAKSIWQSPQYRGVQFGTMVEKEYGMKYPDFRNYFANRMRVELRVNDFDKLRKFYTDRKKGEIFLEDLLLSDKNAILYQYQQFVSEKDSKTAMDFLNMSLEEKEQYRLKSFSSAANWALLKEFIFHFNGDEQRVLEKIQKLYYKDEETGDLKRISPSVKDDIIRFCADYKSKLKAQKRGTLFQKNITEKYLNFEKEIKSL
jgi:hypothetical protein